MKRKINLIVNDIDHTVFDWVAYYTKAFSSLLKFVSETIQIPVSQLAHEASHIFEQHESIEYPFVVQELPAVNKFYATDIDRMLSECVTPSREKFLEAAKPHLIPYSGVMDTLDQLKKMLPSTQIVALTDAPRYVAMWKLNKLGILNKFDSVYGLPDPKIPTDDQLGRVKVPPEILLKHLQQKNFDFRGRIRILPDDYEKPGTKGLKTVLMDHDLDDKKEELKHVLWIGDNLKKDVGLGKKLGVTTIWAKYGTHIHPDAMKTLNTFSPEANIQKNLNINPTSQEAPQPDFTIHEFSEILHWMASS